MYYLVELEVSKSDIPYKPAIHQYVLTKTQAPDEVETPEVW
jgi:hypothetical protein